MTAVFPGHLPGRAKRQGPAIRLCAPAGRPGTPMRGAMRSGLHMQGQPYLRATTPKLTPCVHLDCHSHHNPNPCMGTMAAIGSGGHGPIAILSSASSSPTGAQSAKRWPAHVTYDWTPGDLCQL
jgi:hypothetical protein